MSENVCTQEVFKQEREAILKDPESPKPGEDGLSALCLSGGGIRSATFSLGVLQGLAEKGWMDEFDYLSTVSGGGFIGSWLNVWLRGQTGPPKWKDLLGSGPDESGPVKHLRKYSNYLSPLLGFTTDFLLMISTFFANLVANWLVFLPLLFAVTLLPGFWLEIRSAVKMTTWDAWFVLAGPLVAVATIVLSKRLLPVLEAVGLVTLFVVALAASVSWPLTENLEISGHSATLAVPAGLAIAWLALKLIPGVVYRVRPRGELIPEYWSSVGSWVMALAVAWLLIFGVVLEVLPWCSDVVTKAGKISDARDESVKALRKFASETHASDYYSALKLWDAAARIAASSSLIIQKLAHPGSLGIFGVLLGALTSLIGYRSRNGPAPGGAPSTGLMGIIGRHLLRLSAALFILLLFLGAAWFTKNYVRPFGSGLVPALGIIVLLLLFSIGMSALIGVNSFSLNAFYRRRLKAAYVNAHATTPDDPPLYSPPARPLHIINAALNVTTPHMNNADRQERKAESFTLSALHIASKNHAMRLDSTKYADRIKLSQAMAISGAAASPNMGYHTSALVSFVMAFFNVRLGAWVPNTNNDTKWQEPPLPLLVHLREFFGQSTTTSSWVYLSDGGHFENLGLYEMVRRGCRRIVVVDAGCDPDYEFEDLANAIRKIRIDLDIEIDFPLGPTPSSAEKDGRHFRVGKIKYPTTGKVKYPCVDGSLILIKPVLSGDEPLDVATFARQHSKEGDRFPQQPTSDQFFSESQFESYRALGKHSIASFPPPQEWPYADPPIQIPITPPPALSGTPNPVSESRDGIGNWWSGLAPIGILAPAAVAAAVTVTTLIFVPVSGSPPLPTPTPPTPATTLVFVPNNPIDRIMLPFFEEATLCTGDNCYSLSYNVLTPPATKRSVQNGAITLSDADSRAIDQISLALQRCGAQAGAVTVVGYASSTDLADRGDRSPPDLYLDSMAFNLALADERAKRVADRLNPRDIAFGSAFSWRNAAEETPDSLFRTYVNMRISAAYNDQFGGPGSSKNGTQATAANLTRRVDLRLNLGKLGQCNPEEFLDRAWRSQP